MRSRAFFIVAILALLSVALAGCTGTRFDERGNRASESATPVTAGASAFPEDTDPDPAMENVITVRVKEANGGSTKCDCTLKIEISNRLDRFDEQPTSWNTFANQAVREEDFGILGVEFVVDDGRFCGLRAIRVTVALDPGGVVSGQDVSSFRCDSGDDNSGYADHGDQVEEVSVTSSSEDTDQDSPSEATVSLRGSGEDDDGSSSYYRFNGTASWSLAWDSGAQCLEDPMLPATNGTYDFTADDFSDIFPAVSWSIDDDQLVNDESYEIAVDVHIEETGNSYTDTTTLFFDDSQEDQDSPAPPDEAEEVQSLDVTGISSNEDADGDNEVEVSIFGEGEEDFDYCRFAADISLTLELEEGYGDNAEYTYIDDWDYTVVPGDFEGLFPEFVVILQDDNFDDGETYRLTAEATMDATGQTFEATDTVWYNAEN